MIVLDGGTGRELERRGVAVPSGIWAAQALMDAPEAVVEVHRDFIAAGADVVITNNYAVVPRMLATAGAEGRFEELTALSGALAQEARVGCDRDVRIAGSLPPLASSYRPDMVGSSDETMPVYAKIVATLAPLVDLFVCETMTTAEEARTAVTAATESGRPVWVSWTLSDEATGRLRSGETVAEAVAALEDLPVEACLFNCCSPESISGRPAGIAGKYR